MPVLKIDKRISVGDFQKEFNAIFPYLKIEFFKPSSKEDAASYKTASLLTSRDHIANDINFASISIDSMTTVALLKKLLSEKLGLLSLIYRKSGSMWIETSLTEDWSLERQNHEAEQMSINN
jgi:glycerol-3-phosphate O-acyltransferase